MNFAKKFDIVTCGSATVDVFARAENEVIKIQSSKESESLIAYPTGSKILIDELHECCGGGGTNTAISFARQGLTVGFIGCIGQDIAAKTVLANLKSERVTFLGHQMKQKTGYSIILESLDSDRTALTYKGANNSLNFANIVPHTTRAYYFSSMIGKSEQSVKELFRLAKKARATIAFNPSMYHVKQGFTKLSPLLEHTDILIFNKEEAAELMQTQDMLQAMKRLLDLGINIVIITDGSNIIRCAIKGTLYELLPDKVSVVDATGAGDAFASGFVGHYLQTKDIKCSLQAGLHNSQSVLQAYGAQKTLLNKHHIMQLLKQKHTITERKI